VHCARIDLLNPRLQTVHIPQRKAIDANANGLTNIMIQKPSELGASENISLEFASKDQ